MSKSPVNEYLVTDSPASLWSWLRNSRNIKSENIKSENIKSENIKSEQDRRIEFLETQIREMRMQVTTTNQIAHTLRESNEEMKIQVKATNEIADTLKTQNAELTTKNKQLEISRLRQLCKEVIFACQLLAMTLEDVPNDIKMQNPNFDNLDSKIQDIKIKHRKIKEYIKICEEQAQQTLRILENDRGHLRDHGDISSEQMSSLKSVSSGQHKAVQIMLALMFDTNKEMKSLTLFKTVNINLLYKNIFQNYYEAHVDANEVWKSFEEVRQMLD
jgi:hypothetical protein